MGWVLHKRKEKTNLPYIVHDVTIGHAYVVDHDHVPQRVEHPVVLMHSEWTPGYLCLAQACALHVYGRYSSVSSNLH